jgi:hypothetical protein
VLEVEPIAVVQPAMAQVGSVQSVLVLVWPVSARVAQRVERSDRLGIQQQDRLVTPVPGRFGPLPVGSTMHRLACRLVFAQVPVKAAGQWQAVRLERQMRYSGCFTSEGWGGRVVRTV